MDEHELKSLLARLDDDALRGKPQLSDELVASLARRSQGMQKNPDAIILDEHGQILPTDTTRYIACTPSVKQNLLLSELQSKEILYGGGLAGGKTVGIMHLACQYVHVPGYHCIIFRRTNPNCQDLIDRLTSELAGKATFNGSLRGGRFTFPSGAIIDIGYMQHLRDRENYKGPEYQCIVFEEVTEFLERQYTFMFSRLRAPRCPIHQGKFVEQCRQCKRAGLLNKIPRRVVATCNPDGDGLLWTKERWITQRMVDQIKEGKAKPIYRRKVRKSLLGKTHEYQQAFIPSLAHDNPGIDADAYLADVTSGMTRSEALANAYGWWSAREGSVFEEHQFKRYKQRDELLLPVTSTATFQGQRYRFQTVDVAHTAAKRALAKKYNPSWSVIATWDYFESPEKALFLRFIWRRRVEWLQLKAGSLQQAHEWKPDCIVIEDIPGSKSLIADMIVEGWHVKPFNPSRKQFKGASGGRSGKLDRSHEFQKMLERGQVYIPEDDHASWVGRYVSEMIMFAGDDKETSDQVDVSSMAALEVYERPEQIRVREYAMSKEIDEVMMATVSGAWNWR